MTDNEIITEYDRDFFNNKISIGDRVVFEALGYRHFVLGKVITKAPKSCQIEYINDWNYEGRTEVVRQGYGQIIKDHSDLINRQKAENERLEKHTELYHELRAEARKEFAERLKSKLDISACGYSTEEIVSDVEDTIDNTLKEMEGK